MTRRRTRENQVFSFASDHAFSITIYPLMHFSHSLLNAATMWSTSLSLIGKSTALNRRLCGSS